MNDPEVDRSLIETAGAELGPTDAERNRLRRSVAVAVGAATGTAAAGASVTASATASALPAATAGLATWKVTALVAIGLSAVTGGAVWSATAPGPRPSERAAAPASSAEARPTEGRSAGPGEDTRAEHEADLAPSPEDAEAMEQRAPTPAHIGEATSAEGPENSRVAADTAGEPAETSTALAGRPTTEGSARRPVSPTGRSGAAPARPSGGTEGPATLDDRLDAETALLGAAHRALRDGAPARSLAHLNAHEARYPNGVLREERAATRVLALDALERRSEACVEAARFLEANPNSVHAARVRAVCEPPP